MFKIWDFFFQPQILETISKNLELPEYVSIKFCCLRKFYRKEDYWQIPICRKFRGLKENLNPTLYLKKCWKMVSISQEVTPIMLTLKGFMNKSGYKLNNQSINQLVRWVMVIWEDRLKEALTWWGLQLKFILIINSRCLGIILLCKPYLIFFPKNYLKPTFFRIIVFSPDRMEWIQEESHSNNNLNNHLKQLEQQCRSWCSFHS